MSLDQREEIQRKAEWFVEHHNSLNEEERLKAWEIGLELYEQFQPLIKATLFGGTNKMNVDYEVWTTTIRREGKEDMMSEGKVQFFEALCEYDPSSGVYFVHYIKSKIQYGIFNYLRNGSSFDHALQARDSFEELFGNQDKNSECPSFCRKKQDPSWVAPDFVEGMFGEHKPTNKHLALRVAWNSLSQKQKEVLDLTLLKNYTLREAGRELGIHFTTVRGIRNDALKKMEKIMKKFL